MSKTAITQPVVSYNQSIKSLGGETNAMRAFYGCLVCAVLLGLSACAQAPKKVIKKVAAPLVFPSPPDDARFFYERTIRSSRDVDTSIAETSLQELLTGTGATEANIPLRKPYAIAVHQGRLFVSEPTSRIVKVFDVPGKKYFTIGAEEPGRLLMPTGLDVDGAGNLYVADISVKAVMVYNRDGVFLRKLAATKIGEPDLFKRLASVTVDKKGEKIYALDIGGTSGATENHRVRIFDAKTGKHLSDIGKRGTGQGEFNLARDLVLDKDNNLFVVDAGNARVQVFNAEGNFLREFGNRGKQLGNFSRPKEIAMDSTGNIYVVDATFSHFQIFNPNGELLMSIGSGSDKDTPVSYRLVSGIAVDEDGRVYLVDQQFKKIDIFRPAGMGVKQGYLAGKGGDNKLGAASQAPSISPPSDVRTSGAQTLDVQTSDAAAADEKVSSDASPVNEGDDILDESLPD